MMNDFIPKRSLADEVAARLQEQISLGHYKVNEQLPVEAELMKRFGVGRSTIREAIRILVNSGLLRVQQGLGTFVEEATGGREPMDQRLKRASVKDLDEVRRLLEIKIAEKAALNRSEKNIETISACLAERKAASQAGLLDACVDADVRFHVAIAEASQNEILADLYKSVSVHLQKWFMHLYKDTRPFEDSQEAHEQLLESIIEGNGQRAWDIATGIVGHMAQWNEQ